MKWRKRNSVSFVIGKRHALAAGLSKSEPPPVPSHTDLGLGVRLTVGYGLMSALGLGLSLGLRGISPFVHPAPWLTLTPVVAASSSVAIGVLLAFAITIATRLSAWRFEWAEKLCTELRPFARSLSAGQVLLVAGLSSLGEELLFRGFLQPIIGIVAASALFGLAHQMRGPSRWVWIAWSSLAGLAFGAVFRLTGSLVAPLVAHALTNLVNLGFLKTFERRR